MNQENYSIDAVKNAARNNWSDIISSLTSISSSQLGKNKPCPICGGTDRFTYDNRRGDGTWFCRHGANEHQCRKDSGDGFDLIADSLRVPLNEVVNMVGKITGASPADRLKSNEKPKQPIVNKWQEYYCIKNDNIKKYKYDHVWKWGIDSEGSQWWICRVNTANSKKIVHQVKFNVAMDRLEQGSFPGIRPILGDITSDNVLVVEGARTRDAALQLLAGTDWSVITWEGGAQQTHLTSWIPLKDKNVLFWPDNDMQGRDAIADIHKRFKGIVKSMQYVEPPAHEFSGWDLGDALDQGWTQKITLDYIENFKRDFDTDDELKPLDKCIRALGYADGKYYFLSYREKRVIEFTTAQLKREHLYRLMSHADWVLHYANDEGQVHWDRIDRQLIDMAYEAGPYRPNLIRGRGIWFDRKRKIMNLGDSLILDGRIVDNFSFETNFIYEMRGASDLDVSKPLTLDEVRLIRELISLFPWENPVFADLFFGGLMLAPLCGALRWRPHIWLTGPTGSGKSTIIDKLVLSLLDGFCLGVEGETTEAGIRQTIKSDAIPIIFEEAEMDSYNSKKIIERNISLARQASTETRTKMVKGSADNNPVDFMLKVMFFYASVLPGIKNKADRDRTAVLSLDPAKCANNWERIKDLLREIEKIENLSGKYIRFAYDNAERIISNFELLSDVIASDYSKRFGDQYGALLAGCTVLEDQASFNANAFAARFDLSIFDSVIEETQERDILDTILQSDVRIDYEDGTEMKTIGQLICKFVECGDFGPRQVIDEKLRSLGIKIEDDHLLIAVRSKGLDKAVGYLHEISWSKLLERLPRVTKTANSVRFGEGIGRRRAIKIPLDLVVGETEVPF